VSCGSTSTTAASDAHPASYPLPGWAGYRTSRSGDMIRRSSGRGGPLQFPAATLDTFRAHTPESPSRLHPCPARGRMSNDAAGLVSCYGPHRCSPYRASDAGLRPGPFPDQALACYRAFWQLPGSDFHRQATTSLRHEDQPWPLRHCVASVLLGARN
jgi:hypothetical protein